MSTLSEPFLVTAAQHVCDKVAPKNNVRMQSITSATEQLPTKSVKSPSSPKKSPTKSIKQKLSSAKSPVKHRVLQTDKSCVVVLDNMSEEELEQRSSIEETPAKQSTTSAETSKTTTDNTTYSESAAMPSTAASKESDYEISDDSGDDFSDEWWRPKGKQAKKRVTKKPWSDLEEELVYKGVKAHGVGNWAQIHANFVRNRTNVDIKDKWRTMVRQGRLGDLAKQYGSLPFN